MIGVLESNFWDSTPKELEPYRKMDEMREKRTDYHMWLMGQYVMSAVSTAVSGVLAGRKSKAKYIEKPILQEIMGEEHDIPNPKRDFDRFSAWAVAFNERFEKVGKAN